MIFLFFFFFKQKTAYELRISDWSSDVCSSDLARAAESVPRAGDAARVRDRRRLRRGRGETPVRSLGPDHRDDGNARTVLPLLLPRPQPQEPRSQYRSDERRVGKEGASKCRSRWPQSTSTKKNKEI